MSSVCGLCSACQESDPLLTVTSAKLRWTHNKIQHLGSDGWRLENGSAPLDRGTMCPSEFPMVHAINYLGSWYTRNCWRLWCLKSSAVDVVEVRVSQGDKKFLKGLSTRADRWSLGLHPPVVCEARTKNMYVPLARTLTIGSHNICSAQHIRQRRRFDSHVILCPRPRPHLRVTEPEHLP